MLSQASLRDVFISYSSHDTKVVTPIVRRLEQEGLSRFFAPTEIRAGDDFIAEIGIGLQQCHTMVLFLSKAALESFWVRREWRAHLIRMASDRTARLLPVFLPGIEEQEVDPFLQIEHRIDCRAVNFDDPDALEQAASQIVGGVRRDLPSPGVEILGLPFVIVAMTHEEAKQLESGTTFDDPAVAPIDQQAFVRLLEELRNLGITDLPACYGPTREDWHGPVVGGVSARQAIEEVVGNLNRDRGRDGVPMLRPQFFSADFLSDDNRWSGKTWERLSQLGCVMVVDVVSLFHPMLRRRLQHSEFGSSQRASLVFVSPLDPYQLPISLLVEEHIKDHLPRAFDRFETQLDILCEVGMGGVRQLKRWLYSVLPAMTKTVQGERAAPEQREAMRAEVGGPSGIAKAIFGQVRP
jgi:hypothetical protein